MRSLLWFSLLLIGCSEGGSLTIAAVTTAASGPPPSGVFIVGSSYSNDGLPAELDDSPMWHIFCAKPLYFIFANPNGHCVPSSVPWPDVLEPPAESFAHISFQPIPDGISTQQDDIDAITHWLAEQPQVSVAVLHMNWPLPMDWEAEFHEPSPDHRWTNHSVDYVYDLRRKLEDANPGRHFVLTRANEMLDHIRHDPSAPVNFFAMFRDASGHMSYGPGRYLVHNAFRQAMGQPEGVDATAPGVPEPIRSYLDSVVDLYED